MEKRRDVTIITRNVDDLHERAGSTYVIHVHGELTKVTPAAGLIKCPLASGLCGNMNLE